MTYTAVKQRLAARQPVLLDGATGTELERRGARMNDAAWCALVILEEPQLLEQVHADYIRAGSDIITTNTFATSRLMLASLGMADRVGDLIAASVKAARRARDQASRGRDIAIAGSMSHMIPVVQATDRADEGAAGTPDVLRATFEEIANGLADAGCDLILLEMMYHPERMRPAIDAALATGLPVWCGLSVRAGDADAVLSFSRFAEIAFSEMLDCLPLDRIAAAGIMHSASAVTGPAIGELRKRYDGPIMAYPDSGYFAMPNWQFVDVMPPAEFVERCSAWHACGATILGGCCGLGLEHIEALAAAMRDWP